jgi:hypothetical protein
VKTLLAGPTGEPATTGLGSQLFQGSCAFTDELMNNKVKKRQKNNKALFIRNILIFN